MNCDINVGTVSKPHEPGLTENVRYGNRAYDIGIIGE